MAGKVPGKHGDSIDYSMFNLLLISMGAGVALGIVLFTCVF